MPLLNFRRKADDSAQIKKDLKEKVDIEAAVAMAKHTRNHGLILECLDDNQNIKEFQCKKYKKT